ncbi:hypothetical protein CERSUDRAFT_110920, partial [Gelatoporia subvermispora B]
CPSPPPVLATRVSPPQFRIIHIALASGVISDLSRSHPSRTVRSGAHSHRRTHDITPTPDAVEISRHCTLDTVISRACSDAPACLGTHLESSHPHSPLALALSKKPRPEHRTRLLIKTQAVYAPGSGARVRGPDRARASPPLRTRDARH